MIKSVVVCLVAVALWMPHLVAGYDNNVTNIVNCSKEIDWNDDKFEKPLSFLVIGDWGK